MPNTTQAALGYVILYVETLDRAMQLYTEVFGFRERRREGPYGELETGTTTLALVERSFIAEHLLGSCPPPGQGACEIGIVVPRERVQATFDRAVEAGCGPVRSPAEQPWGQLVSYVRDPDGHLLEICSPVGSG